MSKYFHIIGDDDEDEILCVHGVGHGYGVHTCDGCCMSDPNLVQKMDDELEKPINHGKSRK